MYAEDLVVDQLQKVGGTVGQHSISNYEKVSMSSMHEQVQLSRTHRSQVKVVEDLHAVLPRVHVAVLAYALLVEPIDLGDLPRLVVTSQQGDAFRIPGLVAQQELECLYTVVASIHKVPLLMMMMMNGSSDRRTSRVIRCVVGSYHEHVVGRWQLAAGLEELK